MQKEHLAIPVVAETRVLCSTITGGGPRKLTLSVAMKVEIYGGQIGRKEER